MEKNWRIEGEKGNYGRKQRLVGETKNCGKDKELREKMGGIVKDNREFGRGGILGETRDCGKSQGSVEDS